MAAEETLFHRARTVYCARHFVQGLKVLSYRVTYTAVAGVAHVPLRFPRKVTTRSHELHPDGGGQTKGETIIISSASPLPGKQRHYYGPPCRSSGINVFLRFVRTLKRSGTKDTQREGVGKGLRATHTKL